jgi:hypothetical protein
LRATVFTSVGKEFIVKPQDNLLAKFRAEYDALALAAENSV